jgi:hypothetical protein
MVVQTDAAVSEDVVVAVETVADSVREEVTTSWTDEEFAEVSQTTVTDRRDFEQWYASDGEGVSEGISIAVKDQTIQDAERIEARIELEQIDVEQIDVEQIDVASLLFRPVGTSVQSLGVVGDVDLAMDRMSGLVSLSERSDESDMTGRSSGLSNDIDETSVRGAGDDQITISTSVRSGSPVMNWELQVLDEVFENLSFL